MKVLVTRISKGSLKVKGELKACVGRGMAVFIGIEAGDTESELLQAAEKISNIRIFEAESGRFSESIQEGDYSILCIPNFTLCASTKKGRRPSFERAMKPEPAEKMFDKLITLLQNKLKNVKAGVFKASMDINLELEGPVNINLEIK